MAVQQNKKSPSRRGHRRSHDALTPTVLGTEPTTGEKHRRHHLSPSGVYRGKKYIMTKTQQKRGKRLSDLTQAVG